MLPDYKYPGIELLEDYKQNTSVTKEEIEENKEKILQTFASFQVKIDKIKATVGPTVTLYEIVPAAGIRISKINALEKDLALALEALGVRIIAPLPGRGTIGIEVPNKTRRLVPIKETIASREFAMFKGNLPVIIGKTIDNKTYVADLTQLPHLLIAGATGQGKSVMINTIITSILFKKHPAEVKFVLVDPKKVELSLYEPLKNHFLAIYPGQKEAVLTEVDEVLDVLHSLCDEMEERYRLLKLAKVRNIQEYNELYLSGNLPQENTLWRFLPYIVLVIDEYADFIMTAGKEVENLILRLAQKARAIGIHLIIATQRPAANIITGNIKANFPARIAFKVPQQVDSRTILDTKGAEQLTGKGDLLFLLGTTYYRLQCPFISTREVSRIVEFISSQPGFPSPYLLPEPKREETASESDISHQGLDPLIPKAVDVILETGQASTSLLQRRLQVGYARAGRIMDQLESLGIVGPQRGSKPREILINSREDLARILHTLNDRNHQNQ